MKFSRKLNLFVCSCLILNCAPVRTQAQDLKSSLDVCVGVMGLAFPAASPFLDTGMKLLDALGAFDKTDAVGEALKKINERLDELDTRLKNVEQSIISLQNETFKEKNFTRLQLLESKRDSLHAFALQFKDPAGKSSDFKRELAKDIGDLADEFLDPELWQWSDMRQEDGQMLSPDYKPLPTLPLYATTLVAWMTAIVNAGNNDPDYIKLTYGRALQKHIDYLSQRASWKQGDPPQTLPEKLKDRVRTRRGRFDDYATNGMCHYQLILEDFIMHNSKTVTKGYPTPNANGYCVYANMPEPDTHHPDEETTQRAYGLTAMEALASKLGQLRTRGTLTDPGIGEFDKTKYDSQGYIYGVKPNGELVWFWHVILTKPAPPSSVNPLQRKRQTSDVNKVNTNADVNSGADSSQSQKGRARNQRVVTPTQSSGRIQPQEKIVRPQIDQPPAADVKHLLQGPKLISSGWQQFKDVMPAGKGGIYALTSDGTLKWYRNDTDWNTVGGEPGRPSWKGPITVGNGWQSFVRIVPAGDGVLYAIDSSGKLKWYRHNGYTDGSIKWSGPVDIFPPQIGTVPSPRPKLGGARTMTSPNWANFKQVFSGGEGVIYAITNDGTLVWYHHPGYLTGETNWDSPKNVGTGWADFTRVFSPGQGVIYAMKPTGEVFWYKHVGYKDGSVSWQGPIEIAADWSDFIFVFPQMWGTWTPPVIN